MSRPTFEARVDHDTHAVALDLQPVADQLLTAIAKALHSENQVYGLLALATLPEGHVRYMVLAGLRTILAHHGALTVDLDPDLDAADLAAELEDAATEPGWCGADGCTSYGDPDYCAAHTDTRHDRIGA